MVLHGGIPNKRNPPAVAASLRDRQAGNRIEAVKSIARKVLEQFPQHRITNTTYLASIGRVSFEVVDSRAARRAGIEIRGPKGTALVAVESRGKPKLHVSKGNEELGKALSQAFKEEGNYRLRPRVKKIRPPQSCGC